MTFAFALLAGYWLDLIWASRAEANVVLQSTGHYKRFSRYQGPRVTSDPKNCLLSLSNTNLVSGVSRLVLKSIIIMRGATTLFSTLGVLLPAPTPQH